jgi:hypothetical protein
LDNENAEWIASVVLCVDSRVVEHAGLFRTDKLIVRSFIPIREYINANLFRVDLAFKQSKVALKFVKPKYQTLERCLYGVCYDGSMLKYVKDEFKTTDVCSTAIRNDWSSIQYVLPTTNQIKPSLAGDSPFIQCVRSTRPELYELYVCTRERYRKKHQMRKLQINACLKRHPLLMYHEHILEEHSSLSSTMFHEHAL